MSKLQSIIIAIVEGLTEFLPISSTAHMKITNPLIGVTTNSFTDMFEVVIQLAAILSVVTVYWKKFLDFKSAKFYIKLLIAVIPALVFGALLKKHIDAALNNLVFIACVMIGGGVLLLFIDKLFTKPEINEDEQVTYTKAFIIGCFQVLSIIFPGLSRSAATIVGGMSQKLTRGLAAEFSFFLAVPTMFAASAKSFFDACKDNYFAVNNIPADIEETMKPHLSEILSSKNLHDLFSQDKLIIFVMGCVIAYIIALLSIKFFIGYLQKHGFRIFGWYRIVLGTVVLFLIYKKVI
ncbi:undecaprenyl-diphosphate phosphatase [Parasediminibacterium sp. JCM 36343]|uniref:undecaprenyl-diphosphate phosphatase n=1 Tax=Parasediminibacterium sp. JCM 36343 TaxID=3374279 RepID=UPI00397B1A51